MPANVGARFSVAETVALLDVLESHGLEVLSERFRALALASQVGQVDAGRHPCHRS